MNEKYITCGKCYYSEKHDVWLGSFRNIVLWFMYLNIHYEDSIKAEFPNKFHKSAHTVPKYIIYKNHKKVGYALPRFSDNKKPFLFITGRKIQRNYYIFNVNDNHEIKKEADIVFDIETDNKKTDWDRFQ